jgi:hypothetical protein
MALCFVTQIVENNYSVVDSNVKLRITESFSSPALEVATVGNAYIYRERRRSKGRRNSMVKGQVPSLVNEVEKRGR